MNLVLQDLVGRYPALENIENTQEYTTALHQKEKELEASWIPIEEASKVVCAKLKRPFEYEDERLTRELADLKERELEKIKSEVEKEANLAYNLRRLGELLTLMEQPTFEPLLLTRQIRYFKEWDSWSLGAGEDHGEDLVTRADFSQSLDIPVDKEYMRIGVAGKIVIFDKKPLLVIHEANARIIKENRDWRTEGRPLDYLKNQRPTARTIIRRPSYPPSEWTPLLECLEIKTNCSPKDFLNGQELVDSWKTVPNEEITSAYRDYKKGYAQFARGLKQVARTINSRIGKIPYHLTGESAVNYESKTGAPLEK
jgi:hypothetical protein